MNFLSKKYSIYSFILGIFLQCSSMAEGDKLDVDMMMTQDIKILEQNKIIENLRHKNIKSKTKLEISKPSPKIEEESFFFTLKGVEINQSGVLKQSKINEIIKKYIGKRIEINTLYAIVSQINNLYQEEGYLVCRAILPEQHIQNGYVKIKLIEGKTGNITLDGNYSTKESYIMDRIPLEKGKVSNFRELNERLTFFNETNDIQARIDLKAGEKIGTTDYNLEIYEPKKHEFISFVDNLGPKGSGIYRLGVSYVNNSLTKNRDQFSLTGLKSKGSLSLVSFYSFPVYNYGTKMYLQSSIGNVRTIKGELKRAKIREKSYNHALGILHPLLVKENKKIELYLDYLHQRSKKTISTLKWTDNKVNKYNIGLSITYFKEDFFLYLKNGFSRGNFSPISKNKINFSKYEIFGILQKRFENKQSVMLKINGQYSFKNYLPSTEQFSLGGLYSVRGYSDGIMSADHGISFGTEWSKLIKENGEFFSFIDGGILHGKNAWKKHKILGAGFGYRINWEDKSNVSLTLGFPLIKKLSNVQVDSSRIYFSLNYKF